jgi:asparagine synthetase B (glutamine-hydrolysing)
MRTIREVAADIRKEWANINYAARPYLDAMDALDYISDYYFADSAKSIVLYFLSNAAAFRGPMARELKAELKAIVAQGDKP